MAADFSIRPIGASVATPAAGPSPDAAKAAVPTQLSPEKSVTAPDTGQRTANDPQSKDDAFTSQTIIDRDANEIVYRVVDNRTTLVVRQFPDEARLRLRAYVRTQDLAKQEKEASHTDLQA
ncbi:MAG: hypothetical protein EKK40_12010 [Bradyrhizobiaceae bacterium]|nr:MAG: hypothetical protein EKK40_12010 [Bradyrhizobiaceae bacterium]